MVYKPPGSPSAVFANFEECVKKMDVENKETMLVGDFNCDWDPEKKELVGKQTTLRTLQIPSNLGS